MTPHARLLLLSRDDSWLEQLSGRIDRLGLRTLGATDPEAAEAAIGDLAIEAVLISDSAAALWPDAGARLRHAAWPRRVPLILLRETEDYNVPDGWDMVFTRDAHPQQIVLMIEHLVRECVAEEEFDTRSQTFNISPETVENLDKLDTPLGILSIGQPAPDFLALTHVLRGRGVEVVAALSSYSAFDYLHDRTFDAVLLWGGAQPSESLAIASGMRRNTRLYHTPVLLRLEAIAELDLGDA
ncbi:MAG: GGDEF domain-containing protein, partial [Asticcacaulis sp.]